jgi:hypothetical protein
MLTNFEVREMVVEKIADLQDQIARLQAELKLYEAIRDDYVFGCVPVCRIRTDNVYKYFCERHPDVSVSQRKFSAVICKELGLKSVQSWLDGVRGSFYERA